MKLVIAILVMVLAGALAVPCLAGQNPDAKCAVHVRAHNAKLGCTHGLTDPNEIETTYPGFNFDAFPVFFNLNSFIGVEYGMTWPSWTYSAAFTNCSDLVIGSVQNPGEGASHTWTACQTGLAVPSFLWLYADDGGRVCLIDHPSPSGFLAVLDCAEPLQRDVIPAESSYCAGVYGVPGDSLATEPTTWGGIKAMFK